MGDQVEVFGGLKEGDLVAREGNEELQNRSLVTPVRAK